MKSFITGVVLLGIAGVFDGCAGYEFRTWTPKYPSENSADWLILPFKVNLNRPETSMKSFGGAFGVPFEAKFLSRNGSNNGQNYIDLLTGSPDASSDMFWLEFKNGRRRAFRSSSFSAADQQYVLSLGADGQDAKQSVGFVRIRSGAVTTYPECATGQIVTDQLNIKQSAMNCDAIRAASLSIHLTTHFAIHIGSNSMASGWLVIRDMQNTYGSEFSLLVYVASVLEQLVYHYEEKIGAVIPFAGYKINVFICGTGFMDCTTSGSDIGTSDIKAVI
jgi:hypothetical protein